MLTPLTRYIVSFLVFFAVGLAPFLGAADVPGFEALLRLVPENLRDTAIPISAATMGLTAAVLQHFDYSRPGIVWLRRQFSRAWQLALAAVLALAALYTFTVVPVELPAHGYVAYVQVGFYRPNRQPCPPEIGDAECLVRLTLDRAKIDSYWGDLNVRSAALALQASYWASTGTLVWLIGLLVLQRRHARRAKPT